MKRILLATTSLFFLASMATAQVTGGTGANDQAKASAGTAASSVNTDDSAVATVSGESAKAVGISGDTNASAEVGNGIIAELSGDATGFPNAPTIGLNSSGAGDFSRNIQFQLGNDNKAINMQVGGYNESATLQVGERNTAFVSQTDEAHEAAIAQIGSDNMGGVVQDGNDHAAAISQLGDSNKATALQEGGNPTLGNLAAHTQVGDHNTSVSYQVGERNTLASLQEGTGNTSYINQGGVHIAMTLAAIDGSSQPIGGLPGGTSVGGTGLGAQGATENSAASLQLGTNHKSAILQSGMRNQAVNYQNNN